MKRKQEEVSVLRKNQRSRLSIRAAGRVSMKRFSDKTAKQKWLKVEKSINNITISKRHIVEQEVRMEHFLEKREALGKELETLQERKQQALSKGQDIAQLASYIEDVEENINYAQEKIAETQHNVMEIEETQDTNDTNDIQQILETVYDIHEAKYLIQKLFNMTLSQSHVAAQKDAKLKENEATVTEVILFIYFFYEIIIMEFQLKQENLVKGQLLDHVLHNEFPIFSKELTTSVSSNANDTNSSNNTSRSSSPVNTL